MNPADTLREKVGEPQGGTASPAKTLREHRCASISAFICG
ncbi:hypothetical protein FDUTEX481_05491 [Tolypothrix sp. PCC 7601]|nr:hypothetical protein FDUTEX481_05491 [Tolypothrix sp. PCC 7601]